MPFATPLALLGLLFVPAVVAMYLLKLRRTETIIPSTLLWQRLAADTEANAPWQKLRRSLLFLVQLLLVAALALLAARPFLEHPAGLARDIVLIVDTSASMAATDVPPDRLSAAKQAAIDALKDLPSGGTVSVIEAGRTARIVSTGTSDLGRIRQAIEGIRPTVSRGDLADALALAQQLAVQSGDAQILVATDAALAVKPTTKVDAPIKVLRVGDPKGSRNQAVVALAIRTAASGVSSSAFVSVANFDLEQATRQIEVWGDDRLIESKTVTIDPQAKADVVIDNIGDAKNPVSVVDVRLTTPAGSTGRPDLLASDDRAWAVVPPIRTRAILLVSAGDPYLETALSYLPNVSLFGTTPERYTQDVVRTDGTAWDLVIFEGFVPTALPAVPILAIAPPSSGPLGQVTGTLKDPGIATLGTDEPILRFVDLSTVHIASAQKLELPAWARSVIPGPKGAPLLYSGVRAGLPAAVLAFEPRDSDLPLQVAFPILLANLTGELFGGSAAPTTAVKPGDPVVLTIPTGATGLRVTGPDGRSVDLVPGAAAGTSVTYTQTDQLGVYTATPILAAGTSASPGASRVPSASPASGSAGASGSGDPASGVDPSAPIRFAVDLFDVDESAIAPGSTAVLEGLGRSSTSTAPGASAGTAGDPAATRPAARDELWVPIVLLVLLFLCVEWALYHRDAVLRGWRGLTGRLRRSGGSPG
ncbi:MAG TPA: BatA and WFA domain-containing protein [Candidatus Limnocylindrales bacterium]|nr:BatA and WFA domain-containing protein [Candidatus Limnocylindrales bacterium]